MAERIESINNKNIKLLNALKSSKGRRKNQKIIIEGLRLVNDAIQNGADIISVFCNEQFVKKEQFQLFNNINTYVLADNVFKKISDTVNSQGILAIAKKPNCQLNANNKRILVLNNVQDPGNLGTLIRTADAFKINQIIVTKGSCDVYNQKTLRSTMASVFNIPIVDSVNTPEVISFLKNNNIKIVTSSLSANSVSLSSIKVEDNYALVLGNEGNGVEKSFNESSDIVIKIPMYGKAESLNVAIAGGIIMYHFSC